MYLLCSACSSPKSGQTSVLFRSSPPTAFEGTGEGYSLCLGATGQVHLNVVRSKIGIVAKAKKNIYETEWDEMGQMLGKDLCKG